MKPSETLKPLMRTHARYGYTVLAKPRNPQPLYIYIIDIYRGLRRVFRFCGVFARVLQITVFRNSTR